MRIKKNLGLGFLIILLLFISSFYYLKSQSLAEELQLVKEKNESAALETNQSMENLSHQLAMAKGFLGDLIHGVNVLYETNKFPIYDATDDESLDVLKELHARLIEDKVITDDLVFIIGPLQKEANNVYFIECSSFEKLDADAVYKKIETDIVPTEFGAGHVFKVTYKNGQLTYEIMQ